MNNPSPISVYYASHTDVGRTRTNNQDSCAVRAFTTSQGKMIHLFCIADGLGGAPAGEIASQIAINSVVAYFTTEADFERNSVTWLIAQAIELADIDIKTSCAENRAHVGMGTTLTIAIVINDDLYIGHIGDTRAYILRQGRLVQMTVDHTARQEKLDIGVPENEINKDDSGLLTRSLGSEFNTADISYAHLRDRDVLILSTDGLHGLISSDEIMQAISRTQNDVTACCYRLIDLANQSGGYDNITVVISHFSGTDLQKPTNSNTRQLSPVFLSIDTEKSEPSDPITVRIKEKLLVE